jgi:cysteine desulfurase
LCEESTEADIDAILKGIPEIVNYLCNMSLLWKDKVSGKQAFVL